MSRRTRKTVTAAISAMMLVQNVAPVSAITAYADTHTLDIDVSKGIKVTDAVWDGTGRTQLDTSADNPISLTGVTEAGLTFTADIHFSQTNVGTPDEIILTNPRILKNGKEDTNYTFEQDKYQFENTDQKKITKRPVSISLPSGGTILTRPYAADDTSVNVDGAHVVGLSNLPQTGAKVSAVLAAHLQSADAGTKTVANGGLIVDSIELDGDDADNCELTYKDDDLSDMAVVVTKASRSAPSLTLASDGSRINGTDSTMEWSMDKTTWTDCGESVPIEKANTEYYVRYKETDNYKASECYSAGRKEVKDDEYGITYKALDKDGNWLNVAYGTTSGKKAEAPEISLKISGSDQTVGNDAIDGWYTDEGLTNKYTFGGEVHEDLTLYGKLCYVNVAERIVSDGSDTAYGTQTLIRGMKADDQPMPESGNYEYSGWYKDRACTEKFDFTTPVLEDTTIYAKREASKTDTRKTYQVYLYIDGKINRTMDVKEGSTVTITTSSIPASAFDGWYTDEDCTAKWDSSSKITGNLALYAKTTKHLVRFEYGDGSYTSKEVYSGNPVASAEGKTRTGLTFKGWYANKDFSGDAYDFSTPVTSDMTLYARYQDASGKDVGIDESGQKKEKKAGSLYCTIQSKAYNKAKAAVSYGATAGNYPSIKVLYKKASDPDSAYTETAPYKAGTYMAKAVADETDNYLAAESLPVTYTISPAVIRFSKDQNMSDQTLKYALRVREKTYDGSTDAVMVPTISSYQGDKISLTATGHFENANAGTDKTVVLDSVQLTGDDAANYTLDTTGQTATGTIDKAKRSETVSFVSYKNSEKGKNNGRITADMTYPTEYSTDGGFTWSDVPVSGTVANLAPGTVYIRYKETENYLAGDMRGLMLNESGTSSEDDAADKYTLRVKDASQGATLYQYTNGLQSNKPVEKLSADDLKIKIAGTDQIIPDSAIDGYYTDQACTEKYQFGEKPTGDVTLYIKFVTDSVTFDYCNGDKFAYEVYNGMTVKRPTPVSRAGYTFGGYYADTKFEHAFDFSTAVTAPMTIYAKYTDNITGAVDYPEDQKPEPVSGYTVDFYYNGSRYTQAVVEKGSTVAKPNLVIRINGTDDTVPEEAIRWYTDEACTKEYDFSKPVTGNLTLYEKTKRVALTIHSNNGHTETRELFAGQTTARPADPARTGFTFAGWFTTPGFSADSAFDFTGKITDDTDVYAKWIDKVTGEVDDPTIVWRTVTYYINGSNVASKRIKDGEAIGKAPELSIPIQGTDQYVPIEAIDWYTDVSMTKAMDPSETISENRNVYGNIRKITATYEYNNGTKGTAQNTWGTKLTEPDTPTRSGYTFLGWYTDKQLTSKFSFDTAVKSNVTLYAGWRNDSTGKIDYPDSDETEKYTVTYMLNGNKYTSEKVAKGSQAEKKAVNLISPNTKEKVPEEATTWYTDTDGKFPYEFTLPVTGDLTLYGKTRRVKFTFVYNDNNGSRGVQNVYWGTTPDKPLSHAMDGWTFDGWYTDENFTNRFDFPTITEDTTVFGKWVDANGNVRKSEDGGNTGEDTYYTVTLYLDGSETGTYRVGKNSAVTKPEMNITADGQTAPETAVDGWYTDAGCTKKYTFGNKPSGNFTLYAKTKYVSVKFDYCDGSSETHTTVYGIKTKKPADKERAGYTFGGWYTDNTFTTEFDFNQPVTKNQVVYAKYTDAAGNVDKPGTDDPVREIVKVSFTLTEGADSGQFPTRTKKSTQQMYKGDVIEKPADPEYEDAFVFSGWHLQDGTPWHFGDKAMEDTALYGEITLDRSRYAEYIYKAVNEDGTVLIGESMPNTAGYGRIGAAATFAAPAIDGYEYVSGKDETLKRTEPGGFNHLTLVYRKVSDPKDPDRKPDGTEKADGAVKVNISDYEYGNTPAVSLNWTGDYQNGSRKMSYQKDGETEWHDGFPEDPGTYTVMVSFPATDEYKAASGTAKVTVSPRTAEAVARTPVKEYDGTANVTTEIVPSVIIGSDDVRITGDMSYDSAEPGTRTITIKNAVLTGKDAWKYKLPSDTLKVNAAIRKTNTDTTPVTPSKGNVTLTLRYGTTTSERKVTKNGKLSKPSDPSMTGYTFGGWYKDRNFTEPFNFDTDVVTSDTTLYAKFVKDGTTYKYTDNGGSSNGSHSSGGSSSHSSGGSSGGSHSSGGSSGSSSSGSASGPASAGGKNYRQAGSGSRWSQDQNGTWYLKLADGSDAKDEWVYTYNPYADTARGQSEYDWFHFDASGRMRSGWFRDADGKWYYLEETHDGTCGKMAAGWKYLANPYRKDASGNAETAWFYFAADGHLMDGWVQDKDGAWYYLNPVHDNSYGKMLTGWQWINGYCYYLQEARGDHYGRCLQNGTTPDGYTVDAEGRWTINGTPVRR